MPNFNRISEGMKCSNTPTTSGHETANLVTVLNNTAVTSSLIVADYFIKRHSDVLRQIQRLILADAKLRSLFVSDTYVDEQGKERPMYYLTRDGFTLLAMGFTGKKALQFKIAYIEAFNKMERMLMEGKGTEYANELLKAQIESFNKKMQHLLKNNTRYRSAGEVSCGVYVCSNGNFTDTVNNLFACLNNAYVDAYFFIGRMLEQEKELDGLKKYMRNLSEDLRRKTLL